MAIPVKKLGCVLFPWYVVWRSIMCVGRIMPRCLVERLLSVCPWPSCCWLVGDVKEAEWVFVIVVLAAFLVGKS